MAALGAALQLGLLFVAEWVLAVLLVAVIKNLLSSPQMQFPYPLFATALMNAGTALLALAVGQARRAAFYVQSGRSAGLSPSRLVALGLRGLFNLKPRIDWADYSRGLMPIGLMMGLEVGLSNTSLKLLPVSLRTMIHACGPASTLLSAWLFGLERLTWKIQVVILLVVGGGLLSACTDSDVGTISHLGLTTAVLALAMQGFRFAFSQKVLRRGVTLMLSDESRREVLARLRLGDSTGRLRDAETPFFEAMYPAAGHRDGTPGRPGVEALVAGRGDWPKVPAATGVGELPRPASSPEIPTELRAFVKARAGSKAAHVSKIEIMSLTNPLTAAVCLLLAAVSEPGAFGAFATGWRAVGLSILSCSVFVLLKMGLDFLLIQRTSAFIFSLAGVVHNLLVWGPFPPLRSGPHRWPGPASRSSAAG
ncbi:unnamed protein product [Prorocentrum cordatum]|uniref:Sugar phosphate transporter domain-containing protein n=1 Tax=Prorocentrum cordatum TaxID=2364126 RepID=A0ABN9XJE4_9DINO|nr:unnamed protein product [Polarella glacialis]